jgi:hypothetical protein
MGRNFGWKLSNALSRNWRSQMIVGSRTLLPARDEKADDVETFRALVIFCGTGLLLSLVLALNGWM